jgi:hypothetical protein
MSLIARADCTAAATSAAAYLAFPTDYKGKKDRRMLKRKKHVCPPFSSVSLLISYYAGGRVPPTVLCRLSRHTSLAIRGRYNLNGVGGTEDGGYSREIEFFGDDEMIKLLVRIVIEAMLVEIGKGAGLILRGMEIAPYTGR